MTLDRLLNLWCTSPLQTSSQCPCNWQSSGFKSVLFVDTEILTLWRRAVKKASKQKHASERVSARPKEKKRGLDGNGITWKAPSLVWLLQLVYWILFISHLHGNSINSFTSVQRSGISWGNWSKSTEEKRSVMPSLSATLTTQPSSLWEKATGGLRATKLHSEGGWGEVRVEGIGERCCVGSGWSLERLSIPQLLLAFSGMTRECEWGDTGEEESDQITQKSQNRVGAGHSTVQGSCDSNAVTVIRRFLVLCGTRATGCSNTRLTSGRLSEGREGQIEHGVAVI